MSEDRKFSKAWQYFTDLQNFKARCNFCRNEFSYKGGGAYNLIRHTKSKHPQAFVAIRERKIENNASAITIHLPSTSAATTADELEPPIATTSSASSAYTSELSDLIPNKTSSSKIFKTIAANSKLTQYFSKPLSAKKTEQLNLTLLKMFTKNYLPFHLIESSEFKEFIKELNPAFQLPSRKTMSNALMTSTYNQIKEKVKTEIIQAEYVCITTDGWTSKPNDNYLSVTVHFFNQQTELKSFLLECIQFADRHTAENLAKELKIITDEWKITTKIVAATSDNANNIKAAIRLNNWKQIPCFAHTLNLIVQSSLKAIKLTTIKIRNIVELFRRSPLACERLKIMQKKLGEPELKVKLDVITRWNSTCDIFERIVKIKNSLMSTIAIDYPDMDNMNTDDIEILNSTVEILSFFKDVTEKMSSEKNVTISEVILISNALKNICSKFLSDTHPDCVIQMAQNLLNDLNIRFSGFEENNIFAESTLLDPRFKRYGFVNEHAYGRACANLKNMAGRIAISCDQATVPDPTTSSPPGKRKRSIWDDFDEQVSDILKNTNPTAGGIIEVDKYLEEPLLPRVQDPAKWWRSKKEAYPRLYKLFLKRLCVVATSVPSERIFSKAGQVLVERRNRLSGNKVSQILFLNFNM